MQISAVIIANNEVESVGDIVRGCKIYCEEVIVVDDGSIDDSGIASARAGARVLRNDSRVGIVKSLMRGLGAANGKVIVTLDADGQHDPSEIEALVRPILDENADLVLGRRDPGLIPFSERIIAKFVNLRVRCEDVGTGYRALRSELARKMSLWGRCLCGSFLLEAYEYGANITEVPITLRSRKYGKSHWSSPFSRELTHTAQLFTLMARMGFRTGRHVHKSNMLNEG
jgi:glycosyltransferase involved in cell wall biosynthesis